MKMPEERRKAIGRQLRIARTANGWTQLMVATKIRVAWRTYVAWELGSAVPSLNTFLNLAHALGVRAAFLLEGIE